METNKENSDADLIRQILGGDTSLFRLLVEKHKDVSLTIACSIVKDEEEAQDALQDAFMKVYKHLHKFNFESSFSTWLYRILINTCYTALEKKKRRKTSSMEEPFINEIPDAGSANQLREKERSVYIKNVLTTMKPREALVLKLHYLGEQSISEMAAITELSPANIKVILHRARKSFHADLDKLLGSEKHDLL